ncbi:MAG: MBL fold metallo-hydrolase [Pseudomonadota bacterium]|nr:MBL fold metallo-hydrolase [Pseudomonadota bacterium]
MSFVKLRRIVCRVMCIALACCVPAAGAARPEITLIARKVSDHCWFFQGESGPASAANKGFMSNAGFVVTGDGVVVFDALGTPALGEAMIAAIHKVTPQKIRRVIVSHYHADHIYGLQPLKAAGAEIWAHRKAQDYIASNVAVERLAQRRQELFPWVDDSTRVVSPDVWLDGDTSFRMGGVEFQILYSGGAHTPEDILLHVLPDRVLFAGDLLFAGRVPFVGTADSKGWLGAMHRLIAIHPVVAIPGHGGASRDVERDLALTRDYLGYLRDAMSKAVADLTPFDEAYARTDWSPFARLPAFEQANRGNAYGTYLLLEQEALTAEKK